MLPQRRFLLALILSITALSLSPISAQANEVENCRVILNKQANGQAAINALGNQFEYVASLNRLTPEQLKQNLLASPEYFVDRCGRAYFKDTTVVAKELPLPQALNSLPNPIITGNGIGARPFIDPSIIFKLHSNPTSKKVLYLNFKGRKVAGTSWNSLYNNENAWFANGFSQDSDYANFTSSEMEIIQSVWQRVAEDYSPFDIDVTTQEPSAGAIDRSSASDEEYGTEVVISSDIVIFNACKCSGLAYVGAFDLIGNEHNYNQPAWVFTRGVGDNPKFIAEAITHEAGHTFGLSHDGNDSSSYFAGAAGWAPIMGVGFYQPLTQWSKGEYPNANNSEDEYSVMAKHSLVLRPDEDKNSNDSARSIKVGEKIGGVITSPDDSDYFVFTVPTTGNFTVKAIPATFSPNLDLNVKILDAANLSVVAQVNPPIKILNNDLADGLSASYTGKFTAQKKYFIVISGSKVNLTNTTTNYGSIGTYQVQLDPESAQQISVLPTTDSNNPLLNTSSSPDISIKLVTPVVGGGFQAMELPNGIKVQITSETRRFILRTGLLFE